MIDTNKPITKISYNGDLMYLYEGKVEGPDKFAQLINGTLTEVTEEDLKENTKVNDYAFNNQKYLTKVQLDDNINEIGASAFNGCSTLQQLNFPSKLAVIGSNAFFNTPQLKIPMFLNENVQFNGNCKSCGFTKIKIGGLFNKTFDQGFFQSCPNLEVVEFNEGVTSFIMYRALQYGRSGATFILPKSTIYIARDVWGYGNISKVILKALTPPTIESTLNNFYMSYYVPYESIEQYKAATNWSVGTYYPLVQTESDLSTIDTTAYTKACVIGNDFGIEDDNNYAIYNYTNSEWIKE